MVSVASAHNQTQAGAQMAYEAEAAGQQSADPVALIGSILKISEDMYRDRGTAAAVLVARALSAAGIPRHMYRTLLQALRDEGLVHEFVKSCREHLSDSTDGEPTGAAVSPAAGGAAQWRLIIATLIALLAALFAAGVIYE